MNIKYAGLVVCSLISGCASTTQIVPVGGGIYELAGTSATARSSGGEQRIRLIQKAHEFCQQQGKSASLVGSNSSDGKAGAFANAYGQGFSASAAQGGKLASAEIAFRCE